LTKFSLESQYKFYENLLSTSGDKTHRTKDMTFLVYKHQNKLPGTSNMRTFLTSGKNGWSSASE